MVVQALAGIGFQNTIRTLLVVGRRTSTGAFLLISLKTGGTQVRLQRPFNCLRDASSNSAGVFTNTPPPVTLSLVTTTFYSETRMILAKRRP
jgi:hypothetical protein